MALTIVGGTSSIVIDDVEYDSDSNAFLCTQTSTAEPVLIHFLPFRIPELPSNEITEKIYLFKNTLFPGKRLLTLEFNERVGNSKTVGFIFTLDDLINSPEIFDNVVLQKVAFNVTKRLLSESEISVAAKQTNYSSSEDYSLLDFYDEDSIIVVICDQFVTFQDYNFFNYLTSFFKYGFRYCPGQNFYPPEIDSNVIREKFQTAGKRIKLKVSENNLCLNYFVKNLISNVIYSSKDNEVARFHLFYQVIEVLIDKVIKHELKLKFADEIDSFTGHEAKDFVKNITNDSFILKKIVGGDYSVVDEDIKLEVSESIEMLLKHVQIVVPNDFYSKIYRVRNLLFHSYGKIQENNSIDNLVTHSLLKSLTDSFELLIMELIYTYKH